MTITASFRMSSAAFLLLAAGSVMAQSTLVNVYAEEKAVNYDSNRNGQWRSGALFAIWEMAVESPGATNISLKLANLRLPAGTRMHFRPVNDSEFMASYLPEHVSENGELWTAVVPGETAVLELVVPAALRAQAHLEIERVYHGFRPPFRKSKSGSCEMSAACIDREQWSDAARSVAMITINGTQQCSATLLNNTAFDGTPYLLTARHCFDNGASLHSADSVVAYWNHAQRSCTDETTTPRLSQTGARLVAVDSATDGLLLRLNAAPPQQANVHFAGWDAESAPDSTGAGIHHPHADDRKYSTHSARPSRQRARIDDFEVESWRLNWARGVTEPGSSGSGLFNPGGRLLGQLSGGLSACDGPAGPDFYGRFETAFASYRQYLSADGETGIDGADAGDMGKGDAGSPVRDVLGSGQPQGGREPAKPPPPPPSDSGSSGGSLALLALLLLVLQLRRRGVRLR